MFAAKDNGTIKGSINHDLDDLNINQVNNAFYKTEKDPMIQENIRILKSNQTE